LKVRWAQIAWSNLAAYDSSVCCDRKKSPF
jgi:hypothetical protein